MCGIVGYIGKKEAAPILLEGLKKLEYRGYDSAGLAVRSNSGDVSIVKTKGRLKVLSDRVDGGRLLSGTCGIGHTRWATHGEPSEENAHPHSSDDGDVVIVHNGIIENYNELKEKLIQKGYTFHSETDTEVATKLIDYYYHKYSGELEAIEHFMLRVRGSYAIAAMFSGKPGRIYAMRKDSPLIIGLDDEAAYLASDVPAILKYTRKVYYIGNREIAVLEKGKAEFYNIDRVRLEKELVTVTWDAEAAEKGGYKHFMMKEIMEQPRVIEDTIHYVLHDGKIDFSEIGLSDEEIRSFDHITVVACGSAYHVGVVMQYVMEQLARIPVRVELASEFRYRNPILSRHELAIVISQSGETADSLAALREAKERGAKTLAIVNVLGSSIARESEYVFYTKAGPEIAVATTKAYSAQLIAGYLVSLKFATVRGEISMEACRALIEEMQTLATKVNGLLQNIGEIQKIASKLTSTEDVFFIGRGIDYAVSLEGSLKLKEISYIHSEAYAAGELKHGTISLIEDGTLVCGVLTQSALTEKTVSNLVEVKSRGARVLVVVSETEKAKAAKVADDIIVIPDAPGVLSASLAVIPLQILAYYVSVNKGLDVDKPRNLAKSVTVE